MIQKINQHKKIVLGSGSPRRKKLLEELGLHFEVKTIPVDESFPKGMKIGQTSEFLAQKKATVFPEPNKNELIITADTLVALENKRLGKPTNKNEAYKMLQSLSGKTHEVVTGICIREQKKYHTFHSITRVTFDNLSDQLIHNYIEISKPFDKAGAYGIQEWFGMVSVKEIKGSYFNVMGLPVHQLYKKLIEIVKL